MKHNIIKSIIIALALITISVGQVWADIAYSGGYIYFDNSLGINSTTLQICGRQSSWTGVSSLSNVSNTKLYYVANPQGSGWGGILGWVVISANPAKTNSNFDNWSSYTWCSNWNTYGFNSGSTYLIVPSSKTKSQSVTTTYYSGGYSALNSTQTIKSYVKWAGQTNYTLTNAPGTINITSYKMTGNGATTKQTTSITTAKNSTTVAAARTATTTLVAPTVEGYTFNGWYASDNTTLLSSNNSYTYYPTAATEVHACYTRNITVSAVITPSTIPPSTATDISFTLTTNAPTAGVTTPYYWAVHNVGTSDYAGGLNGGDQVVSNTSLSRSFSLAAGTWYTRVVILCGGAEVAISDKIAITSATTYTLTYNANDKTGGGGVPAAATSYSSGATPTVLGNTNGMTKTGFTFAGWNTAADGSGTDYAAGSTITMNSNKTLYAKWTASVTLDKNGGSANGSAIATYKSGTMTSITAPTYSGKVITGYYDAPSGGNLIMTPAGILQANKTGYTDASGKWTRTTTPTTLYAHWGDHTWQLYSNNTKLGDFTSISSTEFWLNINITDVNKSLWHYKMDGTTWYYTGADNPLTMDITLVEGAGMLAWSGGSNGSYSLKIFYSSGTWKLRAYANPVITFGPGTSQPGTVTAVNASSSAITSGSTIDYNSSFTLTATPNTGYSFEGWYTNLACTSARQSTNNPWTISNVTSNKTYYAKFTPNTYRVTLNNQSATTVGTTYVDATYNTTTLTTITKPTKTNYTFGGYYTATGGGGTQIIDANGNWLASKAGYTDASKKSLVSEAKTLYAYWTEAKYDVTVSISNPAAAAGNIACTAAGWVASKSGTAQIGNITNVTITVGAANAGFKWGRWVLTGGVTLISGALTDAAIIVKATSTGTATYTYDEDLSTSFVLKGGAKFGGTAWETEFPLTKKTGHSTENIAYYTANITTPIGASPNENYNFKIVKKGASDTWYGLASTGDYWYVRSTGQQNLSTSGENIQLRADMAGEYEIKVDYTTSTYKITVTFPTEAHYTVTVNAGDGGTVSASSVEAYLTTPTAITATPATGYYFTGWTKTSGNVTFANAASASTTITANATSTIQAGFAPKWSWASDFNSWSTSSNTLTCTSATSGYVDVDLPGNTDYAFKFINKESNTWYGVTTATKITYANRATAQTMTNTTGGSANQTIHTAAAGTYRFTWDITNKKVTVTYPTSYTVTFSANTLSGTGGNSAAPTASYNSGATSVTSGNYVPATNVTFVAAAANTGYTFNGWYTVTSGGTRQSADLSYTRTISANTTLYARYTQNTHTVTLTNESDTYGTVNTSSPVTVGEAEAVEIRATAKTGYKFKAWVKTAGTGTVTYWTAAGKAGSVDATGANSATTYIKVTGNVTLQATYEEYYATGWYLAGTFSNLGDADPGWNSGKIEFTKLAGHTSESVGYITMNLLPSTFTSSSYLMKVKVTNGTNWYGNNGTYTYASNHNTAWTMGTAYGNMNVTIDYPGTYKFKIDYSGANPKLTIVYPILKQLQIYTADPAHTAVVDNWNLDEPVGTVYSKTLTLNANTRYKFKVVYNNVYYGFKTGSPLSGDNNYDNPVTTNNHDNWRMYNDGGDSYMLSSQAGEYVFSFNSNNSGNTTLSISYPPDVYLNSDPASIYISESATLTANAWNLTSGQNIKYEFYRGTTLTDANKIGTYNQTTTSTEDTKSISVTPSFNGTDAGSTTTSQVYTVRITFGGKTATYTHTVYRKWDIYVHDVASWGGMYNYMWGDGEYAAWPGVTCPKYDGNDTWYTVTIDAKYGHFQLNCNECTNHKRTFGGDGAMTPNISTYKPGTYWYTEYNNTGGDGYHYYILHAVVPTLPTVVISNITVVNNHQITIRGEVTNNGNDGTTAADLKEVAVYVNGTKYPVTDETGCLEGRFFTRTITGLTEGTTYTIKVSATNVKGTTQTATQSATTLSGSSIIKIRTAKGSTKPYIYAWSYAGCGGLTENNAEFPGVRVPQAIAGPEYDWWIITLPATYTKFIISAGSSANQSNEFDVETGCWSFTPGAATPAARAAKIDCPSEVIYQVEIVQGDSVFHSNDIDNIADTLSFYSSARATTTLIKFDGSTVKRTDISSLFSSYTPDGDVFIARVATTAAESLTGLARYTGSFYVRTDGATGTWNDYADGDKTMMKFENNPDLYPNEYYNHYWCAYLAPSTNVMAQLANDYNENLSVTLPNDTLPKQTDSDVNWGTNVRYAYNNNNNLFEIKKMQASTKNEFLQLYGHGATAAENYVYTNKNCTTKINSGNPISFGDLSDWMYQADFYVQVPGNATSKIVIFANYLKLGYTNPINSKINLGSADESSADPFIITNSTTSAGKYLIRVIYDYKTNRIVAAWLPNNDDIFDGILDANMMIIRTNNEDAQTIGTGDANVNKTLTQVHRIYGVLEIHRDEYLAQKATGNKFYWISLPFDVKIKDIFGIDGFKTKWNIQRYRGDLRAANGYHQGETFWRNMNATETAKMEKGRGYVVKLDLVASDFKEVTYLDENGKTQTRSLKRLFFPSDNGDDDIELEYNKTASITTRLPNNECTLEGRRKYDSNWYVAGVPGYNESTISPTTLSADPTLAFDSTNLYYFYNWSWNSSGDKQKDNYTPTAVAGYTFKPFYSYMFQYGGTLNWLNDITTSVISSMPARRDIMQKKATPKEQLVQINLDNEYDNLDRMFITLSQRSDVSTDFDLNKDLIKIMNEGSQVYTTAEDAEMAGNVIPYETEQVPMGVFISEEGTYTFNLEDITGNKIVYLYDKETGLRTCLTYDDYDVTLEQGTYDNRFFIEFAQSPSITTDIETESGSWLNVTQHNDMLYIEGISNGEYINMFDMTGRQIISTRYNTGEGIPTPAAGIYLISTKETTHKIVVQ